MTIRIIIVSGRGRFGRFRFPFQPFLFSRGQRGADGDFTNGVARFAGGLWGVLGRVYRHTCRLTATTLLPGRIGGGGLLVLC